MVRDGSDSRCLRLTKEFERRMNLHRSVTVSSGQNPEQLVAFVSMLWTFRLDSFREIRRSAYDIDEGHRCSRRIVSRPGREMRRVLGKSRLWMIYLSFTVEQNIHHHAAFRRKEIIRTCTADQATFLDPNFEMATYSRHEQTCASRSFSSIRLTFSRKLRSYLMPSASIASLDVRRTFRRATEDQSPE